MENTQKYMQDNPEGLNARAQEFYNRLVAMFPDQAKTNPDGLWEQAYDLAVGWTEDDIRIEAERRYDDMDDFGGHATKRGKQNWASAVNSRGEAVGLVGGENGLAYVEDGVLMVWDQTTGSYSSGSKGANNMEDSIKWAEATNAVVNDIVSGILTAGFDQKYGNLGTEVTSDKYEFAEKIALLDSEIEKISNKEKYNAFLESEDGQAMQQSYLDLLAAFANATDDIERIDVINKILDSVMIENGPDQALVKEMNSIFGVDLYGLYQENQLVGDHLLYDDSILDSFGNSAFEEILLRRERQNLIKTEQTKNENLWGTLSETGLDFNRLWGDILSFDSSNLEKYFTSLFKVIDVEALSEEQQQQLQEAMSDLNLSDFSSLEEFLQLLVQMEVIDIEGFEYLINGITRFTGAIEEAGRISADEIKGLNAALDKLKKGEPLTPDDFRNLITQSPDIAGYFIETEDGYYLSTGSSAGMVEGIIEESTESDLFDLGNTVEKSRQFNEALESWAGGTLEDNQARVQALVNGKDTGYNKQSDLAFMSRILGKMGIDTSGLSYEELLNNLKSQNKNYGNYEADKKAYQEAIIASGSLEDLPETEATAEAVDPALITAANNLGLDPQGLIEYKNHLLETKEGLSEVKAGLLAINFAEDQATIKNISDNWEEWTAAIEDGRKAMSQGKIASAGYSTAITGLKKEVGKLLDVETELSDEFIMNALDSGTLEKALQGQEEAIVQLREEATKDIFKKFGEQGEEAFSAIKEDIAAVAAADIEVGMTVTLNEEDPEANALAESLTNIYNEAYNAAIEGGAKVQEAMQAAADAVNAQGYEVPKMKLRTYKVSGTTDPGVRIIKGAPIKLNDKKLYNYRFKSVPGEQYSYRISRLEPAEGSGYTKMDTVSSGGNNFSSTGGGGGGGSTQEWENPYDEFYNTTEQLNEHLREREKLERRYQRLLDQTNAKSEGLVANIREQLDSLKQEKDIREELLKNRERQMSDIETEYSDMRQYGYYDEKTQQIVIDWSKIEALDGSENEELTSRIEEYIGKLEEQQDLIEEEQDALEDINDAIWEIYQQGKDAYLSMENKIKEAIIADRQKEIDKLSDINDSINDTNSRLIDAMQSSVDKYRQDRENEKTEEELSDKQRRLAYLRQDTSGANALEIMQLQEELDEATEDYTDTLIDQKISELQEQNDKAAEQRQRQIELMQAQLDYYGESMLIWEEVNNLLLNGYDITKGLLQGSRLEELLRSAEGFEGMSQIEQMNWMKDTNKELAEGFGWLKSGALQYLYGRGATIEFKDKDGNVVSGVINDDGDVEVKDTQGNVTGVYSGESFAIDANKNITSSETMTQASGRVTKPQPVKPSAPEVVDASGNISSLPGSEYLTNDQVKKLQRGLNELLADGKLSGFAKLQVDGLYGGLTTMAVRKLQAAVGTPVDGKWGPNTKRAFDSSHLKAYKTGGLADFTGPAWLDGTKSRPEYILNAEQTKSFFQLVDVLSGLNSDSAQSSQITGDSIYDIDINVESVNNDYDVEQMAETIKRLINDDARYRNNNTINLQR